MIHDLIVHGFHRKVSDNFVSSVMALLASYLFTFPLMHLTEYTIGKRHEDFLTVSVEKSYQTRID